tara:strand:- start:302 stop:1606 length:1305 start_codon:yes stop_codon:yes gene_type:complete
MALAQFQAIFKYLKIPETQPHQYRGVTVGFSTTSNVWRSRYSFAPTNYITIGDEMLSCNAFASRNQSGEINEPPSFAPSKNSLIVYRHNIDESNPNNFYENTQQSEIEVVSNLNPSAIKIFKAVSLEVLDETNNEETNWTAQAYTQKRRKDESTEGIETSSIEVFGAESATFGFDRKEEFFYGDIPPSTSFSRENNLIFFGHTDISSTATYANADNISDFNDFINFFDEDGTLVKKLPTKMMNKPNVALPSGDNAGNVYFKVPFVSYEDSQEPILVDNQYVTFDRNSGGPDVVAVTFDDIATIQQGTEVASFSVGPIMANSFDEETNTILSSIHPESNFINAIGGLRDAFINLNLVGFSDNVLPSYVDENGNYKPIPGSDPTESIPVEVYITSPQENGEMLRGSYVGIKLKGLGGEIFAINVEQERTRLDHSLG